MDRAYGYCTHWVKIVPVGVLYSGPVAPELISRPAMTFYSSVFSFTLPANDAEDVPSDKNVLVRSQARIDHSTSKSIRGLMTPIKTMIARARSYDVNPSNTEAEWSPAYNIALQTFTQQTSHFAVVSEQKSLYLLHHEGTDPGRLANQLRTSISTRQSQLLIPDVVIELAINPGIRRRNRDIPLVPLLLLGEYKRSISRKLLSLETGLPRLGKEQQARLQTRDTFYGAVLQARSGGILALRRVPGQSHIILLTTCGDWFSWSIMSRDEVPDEETEPSSELIVDLVAAKVIEREEGSNENVDGQQEGSDTGVDGDVDGQQEGDDEDVDGLEKSSDEGVDHPEVQPTSQTYSPGVILANWTIPVQLGSQDGVKQLARMNKKLHKLMNAFLLAYPDANEQL
ncbi:hypothetical protein BKA62DRAFT_778974 [Auriculariales sp. MPI-PUGE-AT-0066]|nr:hypothetical protein BKA62DRAFT_778974 [Auriculariales sp. MPI-PUGE-AT-0066]